MRFVTKAALAASVALTCLLTVSACGNGMSGSWVPSRGSVVWTDKQGTSGYDFGGTAARPGGLIISKDGGGYKVTLVSRDGSRYPTIAGMGGARLEVFVGGALVPMFFLSQAATNTLSMEAQEGGFVHVMDFKRGSP